VIGPDTKLRNQRFKCRRSTAGEICGRIEAHSVTQPSWLLPTSVGFATSAHAKCAFIVLLKIQRDDPLWKPGGHPRRRHVLPSTWV